MLRMARRTGKKAYVLLATAPGEDAGVIMGIFEDNPTDAEIRKAISQACLDALGLDETTASPDVMESLDKEIDAYFDPAGGGKVEAMEVPTHTRSKR